MQTSSMYIHFPFCRHKCAYCDFYSIVSLKDEPVFFDALYREIELYAASSEFKDHVFSTLYIGGGTPSLISEAYISPLLDRLFKAFNFTPDAEISFEANPGTVLDNRLFAFKNAGFNRITIGIQSFHNSELAFLTRIHSELEAVKAIASARECGFDNIGIDLIFGIPGQTLDSWRASLEEAVRQKPEHISTYGLTYEKQTPLWRLERENKVLKCDEELEREMYITAMKMLVEAGYDHYEISNFARPGFHSRHNSAYWAGGAYLGLGPSAHSYAGHKRSWNVDSLEHYSDRLQLNQLPIAGGEELDRQSQKYELILLGLRRKQGVNLNALQRLSGVSFDLLASKITGALGGIDNSAAFEKSERDFLVTTSLQSLCLTQQGLLLYDSVCESLFGLS